MYDRTCKESLYSTYPYLTYSNKKPASPVMKKYSILGYREKINIEASLPSVVAKSSVEKSFPLDAWVCILSRPPYPQTPKHPKPHPHPHPTNHTYPSIYILALSWVLNTLLLLITLYKSMDTRIKSHRRLYQVIGLYVLLCTHSDALACNHSHIYYICHPLLALVCR